MMLIAVILHLAGVATMSWLWRENLPASMDPSAAIGVCR